MKFSILFVGIIVCTVTLSYGAHHSGLSQDSRNKLIDFFEDNYKQLGFDAVKNLKALPRTTQEQETAYVDVYEAFAFGLARNCQRREALDTVRPKPMHEWTQTMRQKIECDLQKKPAAHHQQPVRKKQMAPKTKQAFTVVKKPASQSNTAYDTEVDDASDSE